MEEQVMEILNEIFGAEEGELEMDLDLFEAGLMDSFGVVELLVQLEDNFRVKLDIASLTREEIATPARIVQRVAREQSA